MRRSDRRPEPLIGVLDGAYVASLADIAAEYGITRIGVAPATVMDRAREALFDRRERGLNDGMQFTFRNPERSTDPSAAVAGARSVLVGARPYLVDNAESGRLGDLLGDASTESDSGAVMARVARYAQSDQYGPLRAGLRAVAQQLRRDGWKAVAFADDNAMVDREIAYRAGLGWFGKNANLLLSGAGSWFVLGSVVTTAPLPTAVAPAADGCGPCRRCLDGCPTGAIIEPGVIDAARCLAWLLQKPGIIDPQFRTAIGDRLYGCDDCQEVCPPTVRLGAQHAVAVGATGSVADAGAPEALVDVLELLDATDAEILGRWGRWYITDRDPRWLRRNALVIIGNSARGGDARVAATVARYVAGDDSVLRVHAVWAARMLGLDGLLGSSDPDPDVDAELRAPLMTGMPVKMSMPRSS